MDYYYNHQEQENYLDADTFRNLNDKLFLSLQVNIEKQNQREHTNTDIFPLDTAPFRISIQTV